MCKLCIKCGATLGDGNWLNSRQVKKHYICNKCFNSKVLLTSRYKNARTTNTKKKMFSHKLSRKITNFMQDAKKRKKLLDFTYAEIGDLMQLPCTYCGENESYNGLDRVDSSLGYIKNNVVPCCAVCNRAKSTLTTTAFIKHCEKVIAHTRRNP